MATLPLNIELAKELATLGELGGEVVEEGGFYAETHDQPLAVPLRRIFADLMEEPSSRKRLEAEADRLGPLFKRFDLWVIPHGVSIMRRKGTAEPVSVGIEVKYKNEGRTCSVRSLVPSPQFIEHGHLHGSLAFNGEIDGHGTAPEAAATWLEFLGLKFTAKAAGGIGVHFQATVVTPYVSAVGLDSSHCEWRFDKHTEALFGRDIQTWAVVALPKRQEQLSYDIRFLFNARSLFVARHFQSEWVSRTCELGKVTS